MIFDIEVTEFYANLTMIDDLVLSSFVHGIDIVFDKTRLGAILCIPCIGLEEYHWDKDENCTLTSKFTQGRVIDRPRKVLKGEISPFHKLVFEVVHKGIIPRGERRHEANFRDMGLGHALDTMRPINWPSLKIKHMVRIVDPKKLIN